MKTRTGKDVFKSYAEFNPDVCSVFRVAGYEGCQPRTDTPDISFFPQTALPAKFWHLNGTDAYFGRLPRLWAQATATNRMVGETCVPIGQLSTEQMSAFGSPERLGLNFMAKGAFWPHGHIQIPRKVLRLTPIVMPILAYFKENLPDQRLWPVVEVVFKISAGFVKKGKTGLDPFLVKKQASDWHTDGDSASHAKSLRDQSEVLSIRKQPSANTLAFLKQRLIVSSSCPTAFSDDWFFAGPARPENAVLVKSNGYLPRVVVNPVKFPAGTLVAFTNNTMHTPTLADRDTHRAIMIVSATINWGNVRRLLAMHPDALDSAYDGAPPRIAIPSVFERFRKPPNLSLS